MPTQMQQRTTAISVQTVEKRVKERIPACIYKVFKNYNKTVKTIKISTIAKNIVKNQSYAKKLNLKKFKMIKSCLFDLVKMVV